MSALTNLIARLEADEHWRPWERRPVPPAEVVEGTCDSCCETRPIVADWDSPDGESGSLCEGCDQHSVDHDRVLAVLKALVSLVEAVAMRQEMLGAGGSTAATVRDRADWAMSQALVQIEQAANLPSPTPRGE